MKKLFVLIFTLTLSTNAFSWGQITCDQFLDNRKSNNEEVKITLSLLALASYNFFLLGAYSTTSSDEKREVLSSLLENPPITVNQILYLIEGECRNRPTAWISEVATTKYIMLLANELKKKNIKLND